MKYLHYPLGIWHSHGKWPIEIDGLPIQNDDFPWQTVSHNQMVSHHEYTLRPGRASWTSHIPWSLALSEYMEPLNGGQSGGINSGWSSWYWLVYGYNWLYLHVSICIYMYLYVSICIYMYLYASICIYMHLYVYIYMADGFHGGNHLNNGLFGCQTRRVKKWQKPYQQTSERVTCVRTECRLVRTCWIEPSTTMDPPTFCYIFTYVNVISCHFMSFYVILLP